MDRDIWRQVLRATRSFRSLPRRPRRASYSDSLIVRLYLWTVFHERPLCWACERSGYGPLFRPRRLPSVSQFCKRLAEPRFIDVLRLVHARLSRLGVHTPLLMIDGKALPVGEFTHDKQAIIGRGTARFMRGYRLHAIAGKDGRIKDFRVTPMNESEPVTSLELVHVVQPGSIVLGDTNYDSRYLYKAVGAAGGRLLTPLRGRSRRDDERRKMGRERREAIDVWNTRPSLCKKVMALRSQIERIFAGLTSARGGLSPLPAWVRTLPRVTRWVAGKIILYHARLEARSTA